MGLGTPAYYFVDSYQGNRGAGFEDASIVRDRNAAAALDRRKDKDNDFAGQQAMFDRMFQGGQADADRAFQGGQADATRSFQQQQTAAQRDFQGGQNAADRALQERLGLAPINAQNERFNAINPTIQTLLGSLTGGGAAGGGMFGAVGGSAPPLPQITAAPVYSQQMIDQQVNAAKANNAASTASQNRDLSAKLAGQGFGSKSPLLAALTANNQAQMMGANAAAENDIRFGSASTNAKQLLAGQTAQQQQWSDFNDQDIRRRQSQLSGVASLIGALGGLI